MIDDVRRKLADLSLEIHRAKQKHIKGEKSGMEDKTNFQLQAKQNLKSEVIPELYITEGRNNICAGITALLRKNREVMRWSPKSKASLIYTFKEHQ